MTKLNFFFTILGAILGLAMISFVDWQLPEGISSSAKIFRLCITLIFLYLTVMIHIVDASEYIYAPDGTPIFP